MKKLLTIALTAVLTLATGVRGQQPGGASALTPDVRSALDRISPASLRGHLSFIASDTLGGRNTPSIGLDVAAEYIAAQFRAAGLEPAGDDGYFQTAPWRFAERDPARFELSVTSGAQTANAGASQVSFTFLQELAVVGAPILKIDFNDKNAQAALTAEKVQGHVVVTEMPPAPAGRGQGGATNPQTQFLAAMAALGPALVLSIDRASTTGTFAGAGRLVDPEAAGARAGGAGAAPGGGRGQGGAPGAPVIRVHSPNLIRFLDALPAGMTAATLSLKAPAAEERAIKLRNVVGILRGSDPVLRDTYVLVTAHYDHVGTSLTGDGDRIFNGANDDGSGTVSVVEIGSALSKLRERPKRTLVFMTVFGEEKGLLGSRYYGRHPIFPIEKTVANVNLEQVGRTDSTEGPQVSNATLTGFDYSDMGPIFEAAGALTDIKVYKHATNSDAYFGRSDNQALADQGVPAHTLCVAFNYPDYHQAGDHWDKVDYDNLARVNRMVALALVMIGNNPQEPKWNEANPRTARYVAAWKAKRGGGD